jgi:hypothetical protein
MKDMWGGEDTSKEYFQKFREMAFNYQNPDSNLNLWGIQLIPPEEGGSSPQEVVTENKN